MLDMLACDIVSLVVLRLWALYFDDSKLHVYHTGGRIRGMRAAVSRVTGRTAHALARQIERGRDVVVRDRDAYRGDGVERAVAGDRDSVDGARVPGVVDR